MQAFVEQCREWQKKNPEWELICDIKNSDNLYVPQWHGLSEKERGLWGNNEDYFNECADKKCKVETKVLGEDFKLYDILSWPHGKAMQVFRTKNLTQS